MNMRKRCGNRYMKKNIMEVDNMGLIMSVAKSNEDIRKADKLDDYELVKFANEYSGAYSQIQNNDDIVNMIIYKYKNNIDISNFSSVKKLIEDDYKEYIKRSIKAREVIAREQELCNVYIRIGIDRFGSSFKKTEFYTNFIDTIKMNDKARRVACDDFFELTNAFF